MIDIGNITTLSDAEFEKLFANVSLSEVEFEQLVAARYPAEKVLQPTAFKQKRSACITTGVGEYQDDFHNPLRPLTPRNGGYVLRNTPDEPPPGADTEKVLTLLQSLVNNVRISRNGCTGCFERIRALYLADGNLTLAAELASLRRTAFYKWLSRFRAALTPEQETQLRGILTQGGSYV